MVCLWIRKTLTYFANLLVCHGEDQVLEAPQSPTCRDGYLVLLELGGKSRSGMMLTMSLSSVLTNQGKYA